MLTADLVRVRTRKGKILPRYVDAADAKLQAEAQRLVHIFDVHRGRRIGELDEAIADHIGDSTSYAIQRGLVKLLKDRAQVETVAPKPPTEVRQAVFEAAAERWPIGRKADARAAAMQAAAERLELSVEEVERALYADLKAEEVLVEAQLPEAKALLDRYNLALAQAVLLRAREVVVTLPDPAPKRARQLFRIIKFHRLMHRAERAGKGKGYRVTLDGPLSLFRQTNRYGLQLALFLPALCHCERWELAATVAWGDDRRELSLELSDASGLVSHTREKGTWESDEERHFRKTFAKAKGQWSLRRSTRVVDLDGRGVLVPDYVLKHEDGREAYLELIWFWRKKTFERRLALLRAAGPSNLVVALATRLNTDEAAPELLESAAVVPFKGVIQPKKIIAAAEAVAI